MSDPYQNIAREIKGIIISAARLSDHTPDTLPDDLPLFGEGLGLDSIDLLEIVLGLEKKFGVRLRNTEEDKKAMQSVATLTAHVLAHANGTTA